MYIYINIHRVRVLLPVSFHLALPFFKEAWGWASLEILHSEPLKLCADIRHKQRHTWDSGICASSLTLTRLIHSIVITSPTHRNTCTAMAEEKHRWVPVSSAPPHAAAWPAAAEPSPDASTQLWVGQLRREWAPESRCRRGSHPQSAPPPASPRRRVSVGGEVNVSVAAEIRTLVPSLAERHHRIWNWGLFSDSLFSWKCVVRHHVYSAMPLYPKNHGICYYHRAKSKTYIEHLLNHKVL